MSESGLIPSGWKVRSLGEIAIIYQGKYLSPEDVHPTPSTEFPTAVEGATKTLGYSSQSTFDFDFPTVSCRGSCGFVRWISSPAWIGNNLMAVYGRESPNVNNFLYFLLKSTDFESVTTGSVQGQITITNLSSLRYPYQTALAEKFDELVKPLRQAMQFFEKQSSMLAEIRDALLPHLVSGNIKVPQETLAS
jgi:type I restriction enzyme S subunit